MALAASAASSSSGAHETAELRPFEDATAEPVLNSSSSGSSQQLEQLSGNPKGLSAGSIPARPADGNGDVQMATEMTAEGGGDLAKLFGGSSCDSSTFGSSPKPPESPRRKSTTPLAGGSNSHAELCRALQTPGSLPSLFSRSEADLTVDFDAALSSTEGLNSPEERKAVQTALDQAFNPVRNVRCVVKGPAPPSRTSLEDASSWVPVALAVALPLLEGALPRDEHGTSVIPHPHPIQKVKLRARLFTNAMGQIAYDTERACDNCDDPIETRVFYTCGSGCKVDFCQRCYAKLQKLFKKLDQDRVKWITQFVGCAATHILTGTTAKERDSLASCFAFEWTQLMFERLVVAVVSVADALVVHLEDNSDGIALHTEFWHIIGLLQILYAANIMAKRSSKLSSSSSSGYKVDLEKFAIGGIDKCDARGEYHRWCDIPSDGSSGSTWHSVMTADSFRVTGAMASFLTHSNLVPISFRQRCLKHDVFF
jgi:hypothetical protein